MGFCRCKVRTKEPNAPKPGWCREALCRAEKSAWARISMGMQAMESPFQTAPADPGDDLLAEADEQQDHGQHHNGGGGHKPLVADTAGRHKGVQTKRQGAHLGLVGRHDRPEETVPAGNGIENTDGHQSRFGHGHHDPPKILPVGGAVHPGGPVQTVRNGEEEVPQNIGVEHAGGKGDHQGGQGIHQAPVDDGLVVGDDEHLKGDHHHGKQQGKENIPPRELQPGKGKSGQNGGELRAGHAYHRYDHRVAEIDKKGSLFKGIDIVFPGGPGREKGGRRSIHLCRRFQAGKEHPHKGEKHDQGPDAQRRIDKNFFGLAHISNSSISAG